MKMRLKPAFRYQMTDFLKGAGIFYLAMIAISVFTFVRIISIQMDDNKDVGGFSGYGIATAIFMFVLGVAATRNQVRLALQFGISRRTAFVNDLLCCALLSVILAAAGELLQAVAVAVEINHSNFIFADIYQMIYMKTSTAKILTLPQHLNSAFMNFSVYIGLAMLGTFFSMLFWLLSRTWKIVAAITMIALANLIPNLLSYAGVSFVPFIHWITSSHYCLIAFFVLLAVVSGVISWLLLRHTNIKGTTAS